MRNLGTYELEEDAARAFDKVTRILGRSCLNFPNSDAAEIHGPRSEDADKAVAAVIDHARTIVAAGGNNKTSIYIGVSKDKGCPKIPWQSMIMVSSRNVGFFRSLSMRAHKHAHTCARSRAHARVRACTCIYSRTRTHTHTHTHSSTTRTTALEVTQLRQTRRRHGTRLRESSGIVSTSRTFEKSRARGRRVRTRESRTPSGRPTLLC